MRAYFYDVNIATDTNPFRYCGEYFDTQSGTYYLRARYYNPLVGRFTTEDPIRDGLNWYAYCGGNPITFIDPLGLNLEFSGTYEDALFVLGLLQQITNDVLAEPIEKEDEPGVYIIDIETKFDDGVFPYGTELLRRIIENKKDTVTIRMGTEGNKHLPDDKTIELDPNCIPYVSVLDLPFGDLYGEKPELFIVLAHELIHAERNLRGARSIRYGSFWYMAEKIEPSLFLIPLNYKFKEECYFVEELATVGLGNYNSEMDITENMIRREHNMNLRRSYLYHD